MAEASTFRTGVLAVALLAAAFMLLPATTAEASCSTGNRVDHRDAECLSAWWKNRGLLKKSPYHVRNMCPEYGKVVAKVDLRSATDRTIHLTDGLPRDGDSLGAGGALTPSFEIGMRHDGGDAETGFGVDMGGGIAWTVPKYSLQIELRGRGLLTHEAKGFRQRGFSGSLAWDPKPSSARGPALSLTRTVGGPGGVERALPGAAALSSKAYAPLHAGRGECQPPPPAGW